MLHKTRENWEDGAFRICELCQLVYHVFLTFISSLCKHLYVRNSLHMAELCMLRVLCII
jgi:hypothetical protein